METQNKINASRLCLILCVIALVVAILVLMVPIPAWNVWIFVLLAAVFYVLPGIV